MEKAGNQLIKIDSEKHFPIYKRYPISLKRGEGVFVWDVDGKKYIDALAGIAVNSLGHCHPDIIGAIESQSHKLMHVSNLYYTEPQAKLAEKITNLSNMDRVLFCNSGAEAVEGAVKLARKYAAKKGKRGKILSLQGCFHGRTLGTIAMGKQKYQEGFEPMPDGFAQIPFNDITMLEDVLTSEPVIALILEPIQGEEGVRPLDEEFLLKAREICFEKDILLIFDEIQTGIGRTGKFFSYQHWGFEPDIVTSAKGLGGGFPIAALLAKEFVANAFDYGDHGTTFGGNPLACNVALAVLNYISAQGFMDEVADKGDFFMQDIRESDSSNSILEVRGRGLMVGVVLEGKAKEVANKMMEKGVLVNAPSDTVVRMLPPLIIEREELKKISRVLNESIDEITKNGQ
ncbi:aspartate aminotransferase family protein [bacterium]|nr:aspartate aminotransferase family protein [bacterium]